MPRWRRSATLPAMLARALASAALTAALLAPTAADAAKRPDLRATKVEAAGLARPGETVTVTLRVASSGKAPATKARAYLSADRTRGKGDIRVGAGKLARRGKAVVLAVRLPATQAPGGRYVVACVDDPSKVRERSERNNCAAARLTLTATAATTDPAKTATGLIAAELAAKRITPEQALAYRVYALFGDRRLPAHLAGAPTAAADHRVLREVADAWPTLSKATQKALAPFFLPPGTTLAPAKKQKARAAQDDEEPNPCARDALAGDWQDVAAAGGKVRVHWLTSHPGDAARAKGLVADIGHAYARFRTIMGRDPLSDAKGTCAKGPDGALDVYLHDVYGADAVTVPSEKRERTSPDCEGMASFIVMDRDPGRYFTPRFTIAHELFHAFQNAFAYKHGCREYAWFDEASANWAAHAAFPTDDSEHFFEYGLQFPDTTQEAHDYHEWPFVLWMERTFGERSIAAAYGAFGRVDAPHGIDAAVGGLRGTYLDFVKHAWNQKPLDPSFVGWDRFAVVPHDTPELHLFLAGQSKRTAYVPISLDRLSREYHPFRLTDEEIRKVTFRNTLAENPDARIGALLTLRDGSTRFEDWSGRKRVELCRDRAAEDVVAVNVMAGNSDLDEEWVEGRPELELEDTCDDLPWHFKVLSASWEQGSDGRREANGDHVCGSIAGMPISGHEDWTAKLDAPVFDPKNKVVRSYGGALDGQVFVKAPAQWTRNLQGCQDLFDNPTSCETTKVDKPQPDGTWSMGFSFDAASREASTARLTWSVHDADVGYFDADDSVCNVSTIWKGLAVEDEQQDVPLEKLASTEPFTLTFERDKHFTADQLGKPAKISTSWRISMTLQRVNADGSPL